MRWRRFPLGALWTNGYLVSDGAGHGFFVDPGGDPAEVCEALASSSDGEKISLERVLLTHGHADHIQGVDPLWEFTGASVWISREDAPRLDCPEKNLSSHMGTSLSCRAPRDLFRPGEAFAVGTMEVKVIATPGHTPGSCCFLVRDGEEEILFSGDTLFARSVGRCDLPGGDGEALDRSLGLLALLPDTLRVFPGHGPGTTIGEERAQNPFWPR